jgi:hypothetical protein
MEPADTESPENVVEVNIAGFELGGGGIAAVGVADGSTDAKATLSEIQAIANRPADAVIAPPLDEIGGDTALHDEIFDQMANFVVHQRRADGGFVTKAFAQPARGIVLTATFPGGELAGGADATLTGVEAEHDFSQGDLVKGAGGFWFDG